MYRLIFMPKNLVVTYWPFSPYQVGMLTRVGVDVERAARVLVHPDGDADVVVAEPDGVGAPAGSALAAVAQPLNTFVNGMPVRPSRPVMASGLATSQLPPNANCDVRPLDAGVGERGDDGVGAHLDRGLVAEPAERVEPDPDDGNVVHLASVSQLVILTVSPVVEVNAR